MPIVVKVVSDADYANWAKAQKQAMLGAADDPNKKWPKDELIARGKKVFTADCVACHQANGKGIPGTFPALDGDAKFVLAPMKGQILTVDRQSVLEGKRVSVRVDTGGRRHIKKKTQQQDK